MSNHFKELLLQPLKDVGIRLEQLKGRVDHVINKTSDKSDVNALRDKVRSQG